MSGKNIPFLPTAIIVLALAISSSPSLACDLCAIHNSVALHIPEEGRFRFGLSEQFTGFDEVRENGSTVENVHHQHLESSITDLIAAYDLTDSFTVQASLPYINRRFRRGSAPSESGTEAGIGDLMVIGRYVPLRYSNGDIEVIPQLHFGLKVPTGNTDRLREETLHSHALMRHGDEDHDAESTPEEEDHDDEMPTAPPSSHDPEMGSGHEDSAIHGHDLALGSGSLDIPLGASIYAQADRFLLLASAHYTLRTEGDHDYRYADDLMFSLRPGYYLWLDDDATVAAFLEFSGEFKGKDRGPEDQLQGDTAREQLFLGPELSISIGTALWIDLSAAWSVYVDNSGLQAVPTYRLQSSMVYRF